MGIADKDKYKIIGVTSEPVLELFRDILPREFESKRKSNTFLLGALDEEGEACGVLWYIFTGYAYEILFMGVHPDHRRQGVGTLLLQSFFESLYKMNKVFPVNIVYLKEDTEDFEEFIKAQKNLLFEEPDQHYKIRKFDRDHSKIYQKMLEKKSKAKPFFQQSMRSRKEFLREQQEKGLYYMDSSDLEGSEYDEDLCFCVEENEHIFGVLLVKKLSENIMELSYMYVDEERSAAALNMMAALGKAVEEKYPDAALTVQTVNEKSSNLLKGVFPENEPYYTEIRQAMWDFSL